MVMNIKGGGDDEVGPPQLVVVVKRSNYQAYIYIYI